MGVFHVPLKTKLVSTSFIVFILVTFSRQARTWEQNEPVEISILVSSEKTAPVVAAKLAVEDINNITGQSGSTTLQITLRHEETGCDTQETSDAAMYKTLSTGVPKLAVLAGCQVDCETIARGSSFWSTLPICYAMSSPAKSDSSSQFTNLFLAQPELSATAPFVLQFVSQFGWKRVAILCDEGYEKFREMASTLIYNWGNKVDVAKLSFQINSHTGMSQSLNWSLNRIQSENLKIVFALVNEDTYREILCEIYKRKLYGREYVWIFLGTSGKEFFLKSNLLQLVSTPIGRGRNFIPAFGFREPSPEEDDVDTVEDETNIHQVNCKPEELVTAADGHFTVQAVPWNLNENARTVGGMTPSTFKTRLLAALQRYRVDNLLSQSELDEAPLAYDSIWAAYLAINKTLAECEANCDISYDNRELRSTLEANLEELWFDGVSGNFSFHEKQRSKVNTGIEMFQYKRSTISLIAKYSNKSITWNGILDPFKGNIPDDGTRNPIVTYDPILESDTSVTPPSMTQPTLQFNCNSVGRGVSAELNFNGMLLKLLCLLFSTLIVL